MDIYAATTRKELPFRSIDRRSHDDRYFPAGTLVTAVSFDNGNSYTINTRDGSHTCHVSDIAITIGERIARVN